MATYIQTENDYINNHPEILKRKMFNRKFDDVNYARDWLQRGGIYEYSPRKANTNTGGIPLERAVEDGYKRLAIDRARLAGTNYPAYTGKTLSSMSDLTQRARGLQEAYGAKPTPYLNKISSVLSRPTGLSGDSTAGLLESTGGRQKDYGNSLLGYLQKEFRSSYNDRVDRFQRKSEKDINRGIGEFRGNLGDISTLSHNLDQNANLATAKSLQGLSGQKQLRRNLLIDNLEQFGNQKHALNNLQLQAEKAAYNQEVRAPYEKANMLEAALSRANPQGTGAIHPDLEPSVANQLKQTMAAYNNPTSRYPGELVANSNPELETSYELMGRLSPKFRDSFYPERKELTNRLSNAEQSVSQSALDKVPEAIRGQIEQLEYAGKKRFKSDLGILGNKYTRLGQYGSPQHMSAAEKRARELNQAILEQRNKLIEGNLKNQLQMQHQSNIGDIQKLDMLGNLGQQEFGDSLKYIRDLNKLGSTKWQNKQAENEELYKNYMNESMWMWPHMRSQSLGRGRGSAEQTGLSTELQNLAKTNSIALEDLARLNTKYNELERERDKYRDSSNQYLGDLNSLKSVQNAQQTSPDLVPPVNRAERNKYLDELYKVVALHGNPNWNVKSVFDNQSLMEKYNIPSNAPQLFDANVRMRMNQHINDIANKNKQATWPMYKGEFIIPAERDPLYNWPIAE